MKVQRKVSPTTILEAEGQTVAEVFEQLARLEEVFHGHEICGLCKKPGAAYRVRQDKDGNKYHEAVCLACGAEFRFGVRKTPAGVLFPQRKDAEGNVKPNDGWSKWTPNGEAGAP
jgi:hypothetical protein